MRLLYGTRRNLLVERCLGEIGDYVASSASRRAILIVPEQTKMAMEQAYLARQKRPELMQADILSFRRLAWRILGEVGLLPSSVIDPVGQAMLIHRVLRQHEPDMHTFGYMADRPGFIKDAAAVLGDLKRYQITAQNLEDAAALSPEQELKNKAHDLSILLRRYNEALVETGLTDAEDGLNLLADLLARLGQLPDGPWPWPWQKLEWLKKTQVWICGFAELRDFTPQEDAIIAALHALAECETLAIVADALPYDFPAVDRGPDHFLIGRRTARRLLQNFPGCKTERLPEPAPALVGERKTVLVQAGGRDDELSWMAGEIRRLVQLGGFRYKDIIVAVCDWPRYSSCLLSTCSEYGIPIFLDLDRTLGGTPLARFVLSLLDVGIHGWTRNSTMALLRSGLIPLEPFEIDLPENEWLARGLFRPGRLFDNRLYEDPALIALRDRALRPIQDFLTRLKPERTGTTKSLVLRGFLTDCGMAEKISGRSAALIQGGDGEAAVALVQSWNELVRILSQLETLLGCFEMSAPAFRDTLATGMDAASGGVIPTALDQVAACDLKRAMLRPCRALFLIGATQDRLPPALPPEGLLKDQDRQAISSALNCQLPSSARDQVFSDAAMIYSLLNQPSEALYISSPETTISSWFRQLAGQSPQDILELPERPGQEDARLGAGKPAFRYLLGHRSLGAADPDQGFWLRLARVLDENGFPVREARLWLPAAFESQKAQVPPDLVRALYKGPAVMSISQLESYASCPFIHFASYLLALQERQIWQPQSADSGLLMHGIVELAMQSLCQDLAGIDQEDSAARQAVLLAWLDSNLPARIGGWMAESAARQNLSRFYDAGLYASAGRRTHRQAVSSIEALLRQYLADEFRPALLEWKFGPEQEHSMTLAQPGQPELLLRGKVDRIDFCTDPKVRGFRVVDYKSRAQAADYDALYHGLSLQLPVYLAAFGASHPGMNPADAAYFHFDRPMVRLGGGQRPTPEKLAARLEKMLALKSLQLLPEDLERLCRHALKQASRLAQSLLRGDFAVAPRKLPGQPAACSYCRYLSVCGFDSQPDGYRMLTPLRCRLGEKGRPVYKRQELIARLQEAEAKQGGAGHAVNG